MRLFNASGHPIASPAVEVVGEVAIPNIDLTNPSAVTQAAHEIAAAAAPFAEGGVPIALPGMATLAAHVLAIMHGRTGYWPTIAWAARVDGKFTWSAGYMADLHELRTMSRGLRDD